MFWVDSAIFLYRIDFGQYQTSDVYIGSGKKVDRCIYRGNASENQCKKKNNNKKNKSIEAGRKTAEKQEKLQQAKESWVRLMKP